MDYKNSIVNNGIGHQILKVMLEQGLTPSQFADMICTSRTNVYSIINRSSLSCDMLHRISIALKHNFFAELSAELDEQIGGTN